jgi:YggT family protein
VLNSILILIVDTAASVLGGVLLLRFWMQVIRVRPPNAVAQFAYQLSDWLVKPLRRVIPGVGGYDWASLAGALLVVVLAVAIDLLLSNALTAQTLLALSLMRILEWILYGFMGLILIEAVFSWVNPDAPLAPFIRALTDPLLRPLRRIIPLVGNIDLSPLVALVLLQIALRVVGGVVAQLF